MLIVKDEVAIVPPASSCRMAALVTEAPTVVAPEYVFAPCNCSVPPFAILVPPPLIASVPVPPITPGKIRFAVLIGASVNPFAFRLIGDDKVPATAPVVANV